MNKLSKLNIRNTNRIIGINILGVSISDFIETPDTYEFLVHDASSTKWMFKLNRISDRDGKFLLSLIDGNDIYTEAITLGEVKIKRLFFMQISALVSKVLAINF